MNRELGQIIRIAREKKGITQLELARTLGYKTPQFVSLFERGFSKVPNDKLKQICQELDIKIEAVIKSMVKDYEENLRNEIRR